ncbi:hypothetical protein BBJ28_00025528 [Nothophytophthora sp. Chile5]|nr:hypothetical protein BBJ28_00025528 [Nothophytophthora sp. Chile5]
MKYKREDDIPDFLEGEEAAALRSMSDAFVQEAVHISQHYAGSSQHPQLIDANRWKRVSTFRDLTMYRERRLPWKRGSTRKLGTRLATSDSDVDGNDHSKLLPASLLVGTFPGDLESVMFGLQSSTEDATRLRASYIGDSLVDERVLALPLESPSFEDPLRSCTLRWRGLRGGASSSLFTPLTGARAKETVYIEATGLTHLSTGERVGYELLHSVDIAGFRGVRRGRPQAKISYCYVYRQPSPDVMEVFMLGSSTRDGVVLGGALAKMNNLHRLIQCAERKKLGWLLSASKPTLSHAKAGGCCGECFRAFGRWPRRAERQCSACDERVCAGCTVYRSMRFALPFRRKVSRTKLPFCGRCLHRAEETSAVTVAAYEAMELGDDLELATPTSTASLVSLKWANQGLDDCKKAVWHPTDGWLPAEEDDDLSMTILGD